MTRSLVVRHKAGARRGHAGSVALTLLTASGNVIHLLDPTHHFTEAMSASQKVERWSRTGGGNGAAKLQLTKCLSEHLQHFHEFAQRLAEKGRSDDLTSEVREAKAAYMIQGLFTEDLNRRKVDLFWQPLPFTNTVSYKTATDAWGKEVLKVIYWNEAVPQRESTCRSFRERLLKLGAPGATTTVSSLRDTTSKACTGEPVAAFEAYVESRAQLVAAWLDTVKLFGAKNDAEVQAYHQKRSRDQRIALTGCLEHMIRPGKNLEEAFAFQRPHAN